jgi:hypothetical protein
MACSFAYVDDVTIAGSAEQVAVAFQAFESFLVEPGLCINTAKSFIDVLDFPNPSTLPQQLRQFTPKPKGIIVLGTLIGTPTFEKNLCMEKAAQTAERVEQILTMKSKHAQFILCRDSANETIIRPARIVPPCHFFDAAARRNTAIFTALQSLTSIGKLNEDLQQPVLIRSSLPTSAWGLGFAYLLRHQPANILTASLELSFTELTSLNNTESATRCSAPLSEDRHHLHHDSTLLHSKKIQEHLSASYTPAAQDPNHKDAEYNLVA